MNPVNSLGFGWLFAYVIMSGSPVAVALTFFDVEAIDRLSTFTMRLNPASDKST